MSEETDGLGALAAALAKAQAAIKPCAKSKKNPHLGSQYSTLEDVWDAIRGPLAENGLAVVQTFDDAPAGTIAMRTLLLHSGGGCISSVLTCQVQENRGTSGMQAIGSAISYARRYTLAALVGVVSDEDNDGHATEARPGRQETPRHVRAVQGGEQDTYAAATVAQEAPEQVAAKKELLGQAKAHIEAMKDDGCDMGIVIADLCDTVGFRFRLFSELNRDQLTLCVNRLEALAAKEEAAA